MNNSLNGIPATLWVCGTVEKMEREHTKEKHDWTRCWAEMYRALGGKSEKSAAKGCPRASAYGLWMLGRLRCGTRPFQECSVADVETRFGRNAAYAIIALELLSAGAQLKVSSLWKLVKERYFDSTGNNPAKTEQGEIRLAVVLFLNDKIVTGDRT